MLQQSLARRLIVRARVGIPLRVMARSHSITESLGCVEPDTSRDVVRDSNTHGPAKVATIRVTIGTECGAPLEDAAERPAVGQFDDTVAVAWPRSAHHVAGKRRHLLCRPVGRSGAGSFGEGQFQLEVLTTASTPSSLLNWRDTRRLALFPLTGRASRLDSICAQFAAIVGPACCSKASLGDLSYVRTLNTLLGSGQIVVHYGICRQCRLRHIMRHHQGSSHVSPMKAVTSRGCRG